MDRRHCNYYYYCFGAFVAQAHHRRCHPVWNVIGEFQPIPLRTHVVGQEDHRHHELNHHHVCEWQFKRPRFAWFSFQCVFFFASVQIKFAFNC